jgi:hypothetical protein
MRFTHLLRGLGGPVAYYPALAKHAGGVKPAIMLCQLIYWSDKTDCELGVYKSVEEWEVETGLSYREQMTARKELAERGLVIETVKRLEHRIYFLLDEERLDEVLEHIAESSKRISPNAESAVRGMRKAHFVHTENTAETTTENKSTCDQQADHIPYEEIFNTYERVLPSKPKVKIRDDARRKLIRSLWRSNPKFQSVEFWERYYAVVKASKFLMDSKSLAFDWLHKPANFKKVAEGNYSE